MGVCPILQILLDLFYLMPLRIVSLYSFILIPNSLKPLSVSNNGIINFTSFLINKLFGSILQTSPTLRCLISSGIIFVTTSLNSSKPVSSLYTATFDFSTNKSSISLGERNLLPFERRIEGCLDLAFSKILVVNGFRTGYLSK